MGLKAEISPEVDIEAALPQLLDALRFYADQWSWGGYSDAITSEAKRDRGDKARKALAAIGDTYGQR